MIAAKGPPRALVLLGLTLLAPLAMSASSSDLNAQEQTPSSVLDRMQERIRQSRAHGAALIAREQETFPGLIRGYLEAFAPLLGPGAEYSVVEAEGWSGTDGREAALHRRIERDMSTWHPVFAFAFLESVLDRRLSDTYVTMLDLAGGSVDEAIERRRRLRAMELQETGLSPEEAARIAVSQLVAERARLWHAIAAVAEHNIVRILAEALEVDPISERLDLVTRVTRVLDIVTLDELYAALGRRVRQGPSCDAIPESVRVAIDVVMLKPGLAEAFRDRRLSQLLELLVQLQNDGSRDQLLLIFDDFDKYDPVLRDRQLVFDDTLNRKVTAFIEAGAATGPQSPLALDVVHELTRWLVKRVALRHPELSCVRVLDVLRLLEERRPLMLREYIERFYRDFHAFSPAGFETVILHLTGILVDYALAGDFPRSASAAAAADADADADAQLRPQDKVMQVLRWYNASMADVGPRLPAVDLQFVEAEQRQVIQRILGYFDVFMTEAFRDERGTDPRFIETLLMLFQRVAHHVEPQEVYDRVLLPFAVRGEHDLDPLLEWSVRWITDRMRFELDGISTVAR